MGQRWTTGNCKPIEVNPVLLRSVEVEILLYWEALGKPMLRHFTSLFDHDLVILNWAALSRHPWPCLSLEERDLGYLVAWMHLWVGDQNQLIRKLMGLHRGIFFSTSSYRELLWVCLVSHPFFFLLMQFLSLLFSFFFLWRIFDPLFAWLFFPLIYIMELRILNTYSKIKHTTNILWPRG